MKLKLSPKLSHAWTLFELCAVVVMLFILAALLLPALVKTKGGPIRNKCINNLKQVDLAFRLWSGDNGDKFPMQVSTTNGGTLEVAATGNVFLSYAVMSNELNTPKILVCPEDKQRTAATNFSTELNNARISYFVGIDACETNPQLFLSGDRNITDGLRLHDGILELTTNHPARWTEEIHNGCGNIGLSDGSVQQLTTGNLRKAVQATGLATNRLAMP